MRHCRELRVLYWEYAELRGISEKQREHKRQTKKKREREIKVKGVCPTPNQCINLSKHRKSIAIQQNISLALFQWFY